MRIRSLGGGGGGPSCDTHAHAVAELRSGGGDVQFLKMMGMHGLVKKLEWLIFGSTNEQVVFSRHSSSRGGGGLNPF